MPLPQGEARPERMVPGPSRALAEGQEPVSYEANRVEYDFDAQTVLLEGRVKVRYRDVELTAGRGMLKRKSRILEAEGLVDSTGMTRELPVFRRGGEEVRGLKMIYNLRTERGQVAGGRTEFERKYLHGDTIRTARDRTVRVRGGLLTTCDRDTPHTDFYCKDLKVIPNDKAIARSVFLRLWGVPVAWVPFYVFPMQKGRHSGVLTPSYGSNERDGLFVSNLGYYFGHSEYWDLRTYLSLRERTGGLIGTDVRYALRERFNGSVKVAFEARKTGGRAPGRGRGGGGPPPPPPPPHHPAPPHPPLSPTLPAIPQQPPAHLPSRERPGHRPEPLPIVSLRHLSGRTQAAVQPAEPHGR